LIFYGFKRGISLGNTNLFAGNHTGYCTGIGCIFTNQQFRPLGIIATFFEAGISCNLIGPILVGTLVSAVMGFVAIKAMLRLVANLKLSFFSFYT
jgi:hypothetical protein